MVYIICILPYEYSMGMMYILWLCIWIFEFILVWGWLGSLLLGIEPRGLYPWDIFSCPMGVSIIDIKVCTFSIDFMVILCFGAYLLFLPRFYLLRLSGIFLRYWGLWPLCRLGNSPSVEYIPCDLLRCSFLWLHPFLAECKILKCLSWLYLLRVMNTPCDLNPFLLGVCIWFGWLNRFMSLFNHGLLNLWFIFISLYTNINGLYQRSSSIVMCILMFCWGCSFNHLSISPTLLRLSI